MGFLGIDSATVGYDQQGIQKFINALNIDVIEELVKFINGNISTIDAAVDQVWAGQSAEAFKQKFAKDTTEMVKTLDAIKSEVQGQFWQIAQNVDEYDQSIADSIKSGN